MFKKKRKKGGGQHLKEKKGGNIGSCPHKPVGSLQDFKHPMIIYTEEE